MTGESEAKEEADDTWRGLSGTEKLEASEPWEDLEGGGTIPSNLTLCRNYEEIKRNKFVCVCVCVCVYIYIYIYS